jgi:pimeloyl-ACP methyl ester carboxylesterase
MFTTTSADGTEVRAYDEGRGPVVVMVHPGTDDGTRAHKLAALLATDHRVLRLHRRQYRLDLNTRCTIDDEVRDVLALVDAVGERVVLYGHSSGAVVALECLVAAPEKFIRAVIYEPPVLLPGNDRYFAPETVAKVTSARGPGQAMRVFVRDVVGMSTRDTLLIGLIAGLAPRFRKLVPRQVWDLEVLAELGVRLDPYVTIVTPTVLLGGSRSPAHLLDRLAAVKAAIPGAEQVILPNRDHNADLAAPGEVAAVVRR